MNNESTENESGHMNEIAEPISQKCCDLIHGRLESRLDDFRAFNEGERCKCQCNEYYTAFDCDAGHYGEFGEKTDNPDGYDPEKIGHPHEYGLSFDYVEPDTFDDQPDGYWRYQLSWGGPSDEFRFHGDGRIEYRYHDWWDGAGKNLIGSDFTLMEDWAENWLGIQYSRGTWHDGSLTSREEAYSNYRGFL